MYRVQVLDPLQLPLVNKFYRLCRYSAKAGRGERVYVVRGPDAAGQEALVAALRLQEKPHGWWFLRSMCVDPELRGRGRDGIGSQLLQGVSPFLQQHPTYCYPFEHLQSFYARAGFVLTSPEDMPDYVADELERYQQQGRKIILMAYNSRL